VKISRLCQLSSHSVGFFLGYRFSIGPGGCGFPLWGGGCLYSFFTFVLILLVALFCVFLYTLIEQIKNNQKSMKQSQQTIPAYGFLKILSKKSAKPKVSTLLPNVCDFQKENHTLGYGFKNLKKIYSLAYGFFFFVISISVNFLE
jgi:hypothetical protein